MPWLASRILLHRSTRLLLLLATALFLAPSHAQQPDAQHAVISVAGGTIEITLPDEPMQLSRQDLLDWVKAASDAVSHYYGRFPVAHLTLQIHAGRGSGIRHGVTYARDGGTIRITVGDQ